MREILLALVELQNIDNQVLAVQKGANTIPSEIKALEDALDLDRRGLGEMNAELDRLREERQSTDAYTAEEQAKHKKWKTRLNDIKSPREFQALSRELEMGERAVRESEERSGELQSQIDEAELKLLEQQERFSAKEKEVLHQIKGLRSTQAKLKTEAEAASLGREAIVKRIPARVMKNYSKLQAARAGVAVALLKDGACTGCNMRLRPQQIVEMLRFDRIDTCPSCKRLLVHEGVLPSEEEDEVEASAS